MKKVWIIIGTICLLGGLYILHYFSNNEDYFSKVSEYVKNVELNGNTLNVKFDFPNKLKEKDIYCNVSEKTEITKDEEGWQKLENEECNTQINQGIYHIFLKNEDKIIKISDTSDLKNISAFEFEKEKIYLAVSASEKLKIKLVVYGNIDGKITYSALDSSVASVDEEGIVTGIKNGQTKVTATYNNEQIDIDVVVTSTITKMPQTFDYGKIKLPCRAYTSEEAKLLDEILFDRINEAGYQTRAGVVAAIRFLMLEFPYRINYYSENGRMTTELKADGEGRYYHRGLYLSEDKYSTVNSNLNNSYGPVMWGCPLYTFLSEKKLNNGLDCSGFVTWTLINGGFDVGDIGAGPSDGILDLTDYGEKTPLTDELINSGKIKAGDLIGYDGHIAIIAGIDDDYIYVAEALWGETNGIFGVVTTQYKKSTINKTLHYVMLMDSYYKNDGNYTDMWY